MMLAAFHAPLSARRGKMVVLVAGILAAALALGCTGQMIRTERLLAAAGFQMRLANTPEREAHLKTMTQHEIVPHEENGSMRFVYADAEYCKCVYVGTEAAYQRYQKYAMKQQQTDARLQAAQMNEDASMNWGMWGPWGPWY